MDDDDDRPDRTGLHRAGAAPRGVRGSAAVPELAATTRMRTAVMDAAHRRAALIRPMPRSRRPRRPRRVAGRSARADPPSRPWRRPVARRSSAAALTLAILAGIGLRRAPGRSALRRPPVDRDGQPAGLRGRRGRRPRRAARAAARGGQQASAAGDDPATEAALSAYSTIVVEARPAAHGDPTARRPSRSASTRHVVVLTALVDQRPGPGPAALDRALSSSTIVLDSLTGDDGRRRRQWRRRHGGRDGNGTPGGDGDGANNGDGANRPARRVTGRAHGPAGQGAQPAIDADSPTRASRRQARPSRRRRHKPARRASPATGTMAGRRTTRRPRRDDGTTP